VVETDGDENDMGLDIIKRCLKHFDVPIRTRAIHACIAVYQRAPSEGDAVIDLLMHVANGGRRKWFRYYQKDDQIAAIEALHTIDDRRTREYLGNLLEYAMSTEFDDNYVSVDPPGVDKIADTCTFTTTLWHPYIRGALYDELTFTGTGVYEYGNARALSCLSAKKISKTEALEMMRQSPFRRKLEEILARPVPEQAH